MKEQTKKCVSNFDLTPKAVEEDKDTHWYLKCE